MLKPQSLPLFLALRYLRAGAKNTMGGFISKMSMLGLIIAVALLVTVLSVMNGFEKEMRERILGLMPHITLYGYYKETNWDAVRDIIEQHPQVTASAPYLRLQGLLLKGRKTKASVLVGIDPLLEAKVSVIHRYLDQNILENLAPDEIILGKGLAEELKLAPSQTAIFMLPQNDGELDNPQISKFTVAAVFNSGTEIDQNLALIHIDQAKSLNQIDAQALRVTTSNLFNAREISADILGRLPNDYVLSNWTETHGNLYAAIMLSKRLLMFLMFLVVVVAVFNIVSSLVLLVKNKRPDVAILKTLGFSPRQVMQTFVFQGTLISMVGTLIGLGLGVALSLSVGRVVKLIEHVFSYRLLNPAIYPLNYLPADIRLHDILLVGAVSLLLGVLATLYPAWRAANILPAKVLAGEKA